MQENSGGRKQKAERKEGKGKVKNLEYVIFELQSLVVLIISNLYSYLVYLYLENRTVSIPLNIIHLMYVP